MCSICVHVSSVCISVSVLSGGWPFRPPLSGSVWQGQRWRSQRMTQQKLRRKTQLVFWPSISLSPFTVFLLDTINTLFPLTFLSLPSPYLPLFSFLSACFLSIFHSLFSVSLALFRGLAFLCSTFQLCVCVGGELLAQACVCACLCMCDSVFFICNLLKLCVCSYCICFSFHAETYWFAFLCLLCVCMHIYFCNSNILLDAWCLCMCVCLSECLQYIMMAAGMRVYFCYL